MRSGQSHSDLSAFCFLIQANRMLMPGVNGVLDSKYARQRFDYRRMKSNAAFSTQSETYFHSSFLMRARYFIQELVSLGQPMASDLYSVIYNICNYIPVICNIGQLVPKTNMSFKEPFSSPFSYTCIFSPASKLKLDTQKRNFG